MNVFACDLFLMNKNKMTMLLYNNTNEKTWFQMHRIKSEKTVSLQRTLNTTLISNSR